MNKKQIEQGILNNRGNKEYMNNVINSMHPIKEELNWQINKFLDTYCNGIEGLKALDLGGDSALRQFYEHKCQQYRDAEHIIKVAKAYS